jgi:hypothetical protein
VLAALGLLTLLAMLIVFLRAVKGSQKPSAAEVAQLQAGADDPASLLESGVLGAAAPLGAGGPSPAELPPPTLAELEDRRVRAIELASKDPVGAAIILTRWLSAGDNAVPNQREGGAA